MSVSTCVKCDMDACKKQLHFDPMMNPGEWHLPDEWLTIVRGDTQLHSAWHFCSYYCLDQWIPLQLSKNGQKELSREQKAVVDGERENLREYLAATMKLLEQESPELKFTWQFSLDASLREDNS